MAEPVPKTKTKRPAADSESKGGKGWLWAAVTVLVLIGGGGAAVWKLNPALLGLNKHAPVNPPAPAVADSAKAVVAKPDSQRRHRWLRSSTKRTFAIRWRRQSS